MENYIGKICPFCKTEIKEGEEIKVCSECDIPHHASCWEDNKGCTTFGCSNQNSELQKNGNDVCGNCGEPLGEEQMFCPKCGTKKVVVQQKNCSCGAEIQEGQAFCAKCGQKVDFQVDNNVTEAITQFNSGVIQQNEKAKKKPIKLIGALIAVVAIIIAAVLVLPQVFISPEKLMAKGDYIKAYEKASSGEKADIEAANAIAICSNLCVEALKDSKSFDLRDAWYNPASYSVVLQIAANNSYGNSVINYWYYTWDYDDKEYGLFVSLASLEKEEYYSWDDSDETVEKTVNNLARSAMEDIMIDSNNLSYDNVSIINDLFEENLLDSVELIDIERIEED